MELQGNNTHAVNVNYASIVSYSLLYSPQVAVSKQLRLAKVLGKKNNVSISFLNCRTIGV